jgi:hypothetical protein
MRLYSRLDHWFRSLTFGMQWLTVITFLLAMLLVRELILAPFFGWELNLRNVMGWLIGGSVMFILLRWWTRGFTSMLHVPDRRDD